MGGLVVDDDVGDDDVGDDHRTDRGSHAPARHQNRGRPRRWVIVARICPVRRPAASRWRSASSPFGPWWSRPGWSRCCFPGCRRAPGHPCLRGAQRRGGPVPAAVGGQQVAPGAGAGGRGGALDAVAVIKLLAALNPFQGDGYHGVVRWPLVGHIRRRGRGGGRS